MNSVIAVMLTSVASAAPAQEQTPEAPVEIVGDVRVRTDFDARTKADGTEEKRVRPRLRARLGAIVDAPVEGFSLGMRIVTNTDVPGNSPHQDFDTGIVGGSTPHPLGLDHGYIRYEPPSVENLAVVLGRQGYPHWNQVETMWDTDIAMDGALAKFAPKVQEHTIGVTTGWYMLRTNNWQETYFNNDALATWQARFGGSFDTIQPTIAATGLHVLDRPGDGHMNGLETLDDENTPKNEHSVTANFGSTNFYQASFQLKAKLGDFSPQVGFDYHLSDADARGYNAGKNTGMVGQVRLKYDRYGLQFYYFDIGEVSVPFYREKTLSQDDFPSNYDGLTGFSGEVVQFDYRIGDKISADLRFFIQQGDADNELAHLSEPPERMTNRLQINLNAKI